MESGALAGRDAVQGRKSASVAAKLHVAMVCLSEQRHQTRSAGDVLALSPAAAA